MLKLSIKAIARVLHTSPPFVKTMSTPGNTPMKNSIVRRPHHHKTLNKEKF